jgi:hypothetical protein
MTKATLSSWRRSFSLCGSRPWPWYRLLGSRRYSGWPPLAWVGVAYHRVGFETRARLSPSTVLMGSRLIALSLTVASTQAASTYERSSHISQPSQLRSTGRSPLDGSDTGRRRRRAAGPSPTTRANASLLTLSSSGTAGHSSGTLACAGAKARRGRWARSLGSLDHFVRPQQQRRWDREAECLGGF